LNAGEVSWRSPQPLQDARPLDRGRIGGRQRGVPQLGDLDQALAPLRLMVGRRNAHLRQKNHALALRDRKGEALVLVSLGAELARSLGQRVDFLDRALNALLGRPVADTGLAGPRRILVRRPRRPERPADKSNGEGPNEANAEIFRAGRFWRVS
jgi:hypothetical protein